MPKRILLLCALLTGMVSLPAVAQNVDCDVRTRNLGVLHQGESYSNMNKPNSPAVMPERGWGFAEAQAGLYDVPVHKDPDYLVDSIRNLKDLAAADKQAEKLERSGQIVLAKKIRQRMSDCCLTIFGKTMTTQQAACMSTAERLRQSAWRLEGENPGLAEKSYRGAYEIYQHEIGDSITSANLLADTARVCNEEGKVNEATALLAKAASIYDRYPGRVDEDMVSAYELYACILSSKGQNPAADALTKKAISLRKRLYAE